MTPKEKAVELWEKYFQLNYDWDGVTKDEWAKEGASIAIDEIIVIQQGYAENRDEFKTYLNYWQEVKQEIKKL
jgi:hypothetical protein